MNKKGFTLIEIIAVIIILGVIMMIAVPAVSEQIDLSRKSSYITNIKSFMESINGEYKSKTFGALLEDEEILVVPISEVNLEKVSKSSPYGPYDFPRSYVVITRENDTYKSYAFFKDITNHGVVQKQYDELFRSSIVKVNNDEIQTLKEYFSCNNHNLTLNNNNFVFKGEIYRPSDFELVNEDDCSSSTVPVLRFELSS